MADETIINGVSSEGDDQAAENYYDLDDATKVSDLSRRIEALEQEKLELVRENEGSGQKIKKLTAEIAGMRNDEAKMKERMEILETEISQAESGKRALDAIAARAADLETEVVRLQHDLISAMSDGDEANAEVKELKKVLAEKESTLETIEKEKLEVKKWLEREVEAKAISESKVCELEKRIEGMQERESEMKREKERIDGEAKARIDEKEREISGLKKRIEELEAVVAKNVLELEKETNEKKEMGVLKNGVEVSLRASEVKVKEMETKMIQLQKEAEKAITGLKEKTVEAVNGIVTKTGLDDESGVKGLNLQWPAVAATATGAIVVAGVVCYLHYGRRRLEGIKKIGFLAVLKLMQKVSANQYKMIHLAHSGICTGFNSCMMAPVCIPQGKGSQFQPRQKRHRFTSGGLAAKSVVVARTCSKRKSVTNMRPCASSQPVQMLTST